MSAAETTEAVGAAAQAASPAMDAGASAAQSAGNALSGVAGTFSQAEGIFSWSGYFQALSVLFLIVSLLWFALWYLKRRGGINLLTRQGDLSLESRLALGPKKSIIVVRFLNKRVLLGITDQRITMLTELPDDEDDTDSRQSLKANAADFKAHLERIGQRSPAP